MKDTRWVVLALLSAVTSCDGGEGAEAPAGSERSEAPATTEPEDEPANAAAPEATSSVEPAEPVPERPAYDGSAHERYRALLADGRRATREERYDDAIRALEQAREIDPGDGPALGELGWAHFRAEHLEEAARHTGDALDLAYEPRRRAMLLYNMGRIAEASRSPEAASDLYTASLLLRESSVVRSRLATIGTVPDITDRTRALAARLESWVGEAGGEPCPVQADPEDGDGEPADDFSCDVEVVEGSAPPLEWLVVSETYTRAPPEETTYSLWARTPRGVFQLGRLARDWRGMWGGEEMSATLDFSIVQLVPGGAPELLARFGEEGEDPDWCEGWAGRDRSVALCGLGAGGVPVCWGVLQTYQLSYRTLGRVADVLDDDDEAVGRCAVTGARIAAAERAEEAARDVADEHAFDVSVAPDGALSWTGATPPEIARVRRASELGCLLPQPPLELECAPAAAP